MEKVLERFAVWHKGIIVDGYDPKKFRKDVCGAWIIWSHYGKKTNFSWHIDHIIPKVLGGSSSLKNLQPLQWKNNLAKNGKILFEPAVVSFYNYNLNLNKRV